MQRKYLPIHSKISLSRARGSYEEARRVRSQATQGENLETHQGEKVETLDSKGK